MTTPIPTCTCAGHPLECFGHPDDCLCAEPWFIRLFTHVDAADKLIWRVRIVLWFGMMGYVILHLIGVVS